MRGYQIEITDMNEFAATGGDYYGFDIEAGDKLSENYFDLSLPDAIQSFLDAYGGSPDNLTIREIEIGGIEVFNLCMCGAAAGYPHDPDCPFPYFLGWSDEWWAAYLAKKQERARHTSGAAPENQAENVAHRRV